MFDTRTINMPILQRSAISGAQADSPMVAERILVDVVPAHYYHLGDVVGGQIGGVGGDAVPGLAFGEGAECGLAGVCVPVVPDDHDGADEYPLRR